MTIHELEIKVKELDAGRNFFILNDGISIHILRYSRKKCLWEYYFEDERGGIHDYQLFASEAEACDFVYQDAKLTIDIYSRAMK